MNPSPDRIFVVGRHTRSRRGRRAGVDQTTRRPLRADAGGPLSPTSEAAFEATVHEYSAEDRLEATHLPFGERDAQDRRRFRQDFAHDSKGRVSSVDSPYEWCRNADGTIFRGQASRTSYTHWDTDWIRTTSEPQTVTPGVTTSSGPSVKFSYAYDRGGEDVPIAVETSGRLRR